MQILGTPHLLQHGFSLEGVEGGWSLCLKCFCHFGKDRTASQISKVILLYLYGIGKRGQTLGRLSCIGYLPSNTPLLSAGLTHEQRILWRHTH